MSAIITEKFRQHNANQFFESFTEASASTYYLFIGKSTAFTASTTTGNDSSPPTPADEIGEIHYYAWDSMLAAKDKFYRCNLRTSQKKLVKWYNL